jgi:hypothetical protein
VRQAEAELEQLIERPKKFPDSKFPVWTFPTIVIYETHRLHDNIPIEKFVLPCEILLPDKLIGSCNCAKLCLWHTGAALRFYLHTDLVTADATARSKLPPATADISTSGPHEGLEAKRTLWRALQLIQYLRFTTLIAQPMFGLDEVTRGIRHSFDTFTVPIWVTFGLRLLLDIQDIMELSDRSWRDAM